MGEKEISGGTEKTEKDLASLLSSFISKDKKVQLEYFPRILKQLAQAKTVLNGDENEILLKIFITVAQPDFAKELMERIDKGLFFDFGTYLNNERSVQTLNFIIHEYLNLFRHSALLRRIYNEQKWETLILDLILKSNFNMNILFNQRLRDYKDKPLFNIIKGSSVTTLSWLKVADQIKIYERSLKNLLTNKEDKVAFLLENSPEMAMLDLACLTRGIINVMIPANSVVEHIKFILQETKAAVLLVQSEKELSEIKSLKNVLPDLKKVILLNGNSNDDWVIEFEKFKKPDVDSSTSEMNFDHDINDIATIMYTSGTTGEPKGIMFSQTNIVYKRFCRAMAIPEIGDEDRFICFLPLYHTFGRYLEMTGSVFWAAEYCFMENPSVETMIANMQLVKPSVFISIPKKWLQLYEYITSKVDIETDEVEKIKSETERITGKNLKWGLSAAGYLPSDVFKFFQSNGIELMSGFGMTEATGGITMTPPNQYKPNSLGKALPGIQIKLGDDGEILIKGPYVMLGYFNIPDSETFTDDGSSEPRSAGTGWLPSGDIMKMDDDGFIEIIDRKKEIYKNVKGETIAPQKIENLFRDFEFVKQVFLVGDHRQFNTVLIYPILDDENSPLKNMDDQQKQEYFASIIVTVNKFLSPFERILDFRIIDRPFSDSYEELTPKGTYKRRNVEKNFSKLISSMYEKNYTSLFKDQFEVRVPNWFLREKGILNRDIIITENYIEIPKLNIKVEFKFKHNGKTECVVGNYRYLLKEKLLDLQDLLNNPLLWIGNKKLFDFAGNGIFHWSRKESRSSEVSFLSVEDSTSAIDEEIEIIKKINSSDDFSLFGLNLAFRIICSQNENQTAALSYIGKIITNEANPFNSLCLNIAARASIYRTTEIRRRVFLTLLKVSEEAQFGFLFNTFLNADSEILNDEVIILITETEKGNERLRVIENYITKALNNYAVNKSSKILVQSLFELISLDGMKHPTNFSRVRRFIMRHQAFSLDAFVKDSAEKSLQKLQQGLRDWMGVNHGMAIDTETGEEYSWEDVLVFEEGIDAEDRLRIKNAIVKTQLIREAVFLFSNGIALRLDNILPSGIWISQLESRNDKSIYRAIIQTRFQGGFDITIHLNKGLPTSKVKEEIKWLVIAGTNIRGERLLPHFGGHWEEYDLWTEAFVPRDSVAKFLERESKNQEDQSMQRVKFLWPYFVWNAAAAYMNFWKLTNYTIQLANPLPENITIPTHDYQSGTLLYSVSKRIGTHSGFIFCKNFYSLFIKQTVKAYPVFSKKSIWNYIFSGIIESEGEEKGLKLLQNIKEEAKSSNDFKEKDELIRRIDLFLGNVSTNGFISRSIFFAMKRFHRWFELNKDAALSAQAEMLYELYETYNMFELEKSNPAARTQFFLLTVFSNSSDELKNALSSIAKKQFHNEVTKEESQELIYKLHSSIALNEKEEYFLTRLSYPHLKPSDSASIIKTIAEGFAGSNLVMQFLDEDGNPFLIRGPITPKEISKLQQLFLETNLLVRFKPEHKFLVALSERGFIIGGMFYLITDNESAHMEKIVVSPRYRRKGISEALMNELFNRLKNEHFKFVSTGFFRPEYFYRFGFKIEKKYSGLVKDLTK